MKKLMKQQPGRVPRFVLLGLGTALALSGCGSSDKAETAKSAAQEWGDRKYGEYPESPMTKLMGYDSEKMSATAREQQKNAEYAIVECMQAQGFEYTPNLQAANFDFSPPDIDLTQREYAEKWCFGMTTTVDEDGNQIEDAPGFGGGPDSEYTDPNQERMDAMSESERTAYQEALYGPMTADGEVDVESGEPSISVPDEEPQGCANKAWSDSGNEQGKAQEKLGEMYSDFYERAQADPRIKAASKEYRECTKAAGYPKLKSPDQVYEILSDKMNAVYGMDSNGGSSAPIPVEGDSGEVSGDSGDDSSAPADGDFGPPKIDKKALKEAQEFERKVAVAEFPCRAAYSVVQEKVNNELEEDFIKKNKDLVNEVKEELGSK